MRGTMKSTIFSLTGEKNFFLHFNLDLCIKTKRKPKSLLKIVQVQDKETVSEPTPKKHKGLRTVQDTVTEGPNLNS